MSSGFEILWGCKGGKEWDQLVVNWCKLERAYGLKNSTTPLPAAGRPQAIGDWVKGGRSTTRKPKIVLEDHIASWIAWWDGMAPDWRIRDAEGNLLREREGAWGRLVRPGGNGMLTALICLVWWLEGEGKTTERWLAAVRDANWVVEGLVREVNERYVVRHVRR
ncbi:hypothetical protein C8F04DRAFT_953941 [Mycena alexandri]|uniref:Uncharacterized protein n=1 Tax=Mycena alexandri TaxID=1745969 RepID=A0AAD6T361_9AGAR|nr:hypothetical protein C8F04DRAFT_953941 [Mycena alexandri]